MSEQLAEVVARCKGSVVLTVNGERDTRQARGEYLEGSVEGEELARLLAAPDLYELQFYPDTPVGFYLVYGTSLEHVARRAIGALNADGAPPYRRLPPA